jgi:hypothetical protein
MPIFWEFPFSVCVEAPDEALGWLEGFADMAAPSGWGVELGSNTMHFRFAKQEEAVGFILGCRHSAGFCL